jgi:hypothetical protein
MKAVPRLRIAAASKNVAVRVTPSSKRSARCFRSRAASVGGATVSPAA